MLAFAETEQSAATIAVFIVTFLGTLALGRLLKRRAGVPFGIFFQLFALTLAFYTAAWVYGLELQWRNHAGAALVLLSTAVVIALVDRYLWDLYFEQGRQTVIPKFLRDLVAGVIFLIALLLVLSVGYHAQSQLTWLLSGSGLAAIILAFATQNLLGGVIAGMSVQINKPYKVGDWLQVGERFAEVMEINWRSSRLRTNDNIYLDIPNNEIVRTTIVNLHYPTNLHAMRVRVGIDYNVPPNRVKDALFHAAMSAKNVLQDPPVRIFLVEFSEYSIIYEIKFYMSDHSKINETNDSVRTNVWYELKRQNITIPFPIRTLEVNRKAVPKPHEQHGRARTILEGEPLFASLTEAQLDGLIRASRTLRFGRGEKVIDQGAEGSSMFVLLHGTAHVSVAQNGAMIRVGSLRMGDSFGEMSLLTGERRSATVRAEDDCEVLEISKPAMAALLHDAPECVAQLSELLAARKMETEGLLKDAHESPAAETRKREYRATFLRRVRSVFEL
ncbi:MAG TPA: mechanosensitive ion channel family protein [Chthoniobacterales bacterium]|nr:mechanosensitive ion channel family protein [Chthoniobacterales bacterium]